MNQMVLSGAGNGTKKSDSLQKFRDWGIKQLSIIKSFKSSNSKIFLKHARYFSGYTLRFALGFRLVYLFS